MRIRALLVAAAVGALALAGAANPALANRGGPPQHLRELIGALHEHSGYSDGWPGSTPATYYASGRDKHHLDFMAGSEHTSNVNSPFTFNEECLDPVVAPTCQVADPVNPLNALHKWDAELAQAKAATDPAKDFTAFRGFEWTSDRMGHINVYFPGANSLPETDGGNLAIDRFYDWLTTTGSDGLATFNHPGEKTLCGPLKCDVHSDLGFGWEDFKYVPKADDQMAGIEVFNGNRDFGTSLDHNAPAEGWYSYALDKGWHVGAIGAEDNGHERVDDWGGPQYAKTVMLAKSNTAKDLKQAMADRRFYAVLDNALRLDFTIDGHGIGERIRSNGKLTIDADVRGSSTPLQLELVSNGGKVVASATGDRLGTKLTATDDSWYFLRVLRDGKPVAYSSPIWVNDRKQPAAPVAPKGDSLRTKDGTWLAGDLNVHTCDDSAVYCAQTDPRSQADPFRQGVDVRDRFAEAGGRDLDYIAITDDKAHPVNGSHGVLAIPGYQDHLKGDAQVFGVSKQLSNGDGSAAAVNELANAVRAKGGVFQIDHPGEGITKKFAGCDASTLSWGYNFDVKPDTVEVWNPNSSIRAAEDYLDCWLQRGDRVALTGGSDARTLVAQPQGAGFPTTWVLAKDKSAKGVLDAVRAGRTSVSVLPPSAGGRPLVIEAQRGGRYVPVLGDDVRPGERLRVRSMDPLTDGSLRVIANDKTLLDQHLTRDGSIQFTAPAEPGWLRAELRLGNDLLEASPLCGPVDLGANLCPYDAAMVAMTSPVYVR
ncbi:CehA/McbA family metallohydrolase [Actinoplanes sp. TBRC 11911]|uniref:CehA/McbA family metallohydrolase n=1 Tax=Actinoplanes sp. TBRC 11911 TaxID=2729386 RepID=UPI00145D0120|nr:CehA/McbA family metallohydrolase [Actinoplanes sp. TBRC 11911]NMO54569.1 CehA/McbA family metallohydrolase [Actinoplanes sp. TBRC 11911]